MFAYIRTRTANVFVNKSGGEMNTAVLTSAVSVHAVNFEFTPTDYRYSRAALASLTRVLW